MGIHASSAEAMYERLAQQRDPYLQRGRDVAKLTIPHLLTEEGWGGSQKLYTPFQGIGARAVASLSSKLLMALFPPNTPFFRLVVDQYKLDEITGDPDIRTEVETTLNRIEQAVMAEIESQNYRPHIHEALKQLIIAGNALVHLPEGGGMKVFKMDRYVIKSDPSGETQTIILKESISPASLPKYLMERAQQEATSMEDTVDMYTCIHRKSADEYEVWQEAFGDRIEQTTGTYPADELPWIPLRMELVTGESWGYGYATQYLGDLKSLEGLSQAMVEAAAMSAKCLWLVDPASQTRARTLAEAPNGAIREGRAEDVTMVTMAGKASDMRIAFESIEQIRDRLGLAFLMTQGLQRNADRQTATEWRILAEELESVLAGTYSLLSQIMQLKMVSVLMVRMTTEKRLPQIPKDIVKPTVVTGLEALGRGADLQRLDAFVQGAGGVLGPELLNQYMNINDYLSRRATALGLVTDGLIKSEEDIQAEKQQQQMMATAQTFGPDAMKIAAGQMNQQSAAAMQPPPTQA
tara:strand:+ start:5933 stop:7498 length:1566 start_codon:yes stop_codon:yes gene_type:complete